MIAEQTLVDITKRLVEGFEPDQIILFGSQARGTANKHSLYIFLSYESR